MGTIILLIAFVIEAAFAVYCMITKSNQEKVKSYIRIGAFATFVLFTLVSVIQWNFTWYLLAALLFIWAALGAWSLLRKPAEKKDYKAVPAVIRAIADAAISRHRRHAGPGLPTASAAPGNRHAPSRHGPVYVYQ